MWYGLVLVRPTTDIQGNLQTGYGLHLVTNKQQTKLALLK